MLITSVSDPRMEEAEEQELQITTQWLTRLLADPGTTPQPGLPFVAAVQVRHLLDGVWFPSPDLSLCS